MWKSTREAEARESKAEVKARASLGYVVSSGTYSETVLRNKQLPNRNTSKKEILAHITCSDIYPIVSVP